MSGVTAQPVDSTRPRRGSLWLRVISALVLAPPVILITLAGAPWFGLMVGAGALILTWEWGRLCRASFTHQAMLMVFTSLTVATAVSGRMDAAMAVAAAGAVTLLIVARGGGWSSVGLGYIAIPAVAFIWLRGDTEDGKLIALWLLFCVWAYDVGAYCFGRLIGGPRLAPTISPNKTWAGFVGGTVCAGAAGTTVFLVHGGSVAWGWPFASAALGMSAQAGDLFESAAKRRFGVKDTSGLIPGHGGLLDRVDGLIAATLLAALITVIDRGTMHTWM